MGKQDNVDWTVQPDASGKYTYDQAQLTVLMDIRRELQTANRYLAVLQCSNFLRIPRDLQQIRRNTNKKKREGRHE